MNFTEKPDCLGNMKTIDEIQNMINNKSYIPLLQRNYKWTKECAAELAEDLWEHFNKYKGSEKKYLLNMITIYKNGEDNLQIIDGQQRLITLKLLLKVLDPDNTYLEFQFERDKDIEENRKRIQFINGVLSEWKEKGFETFEPKTEDIRRLWNNFCAMIIPLSFKTVFGYYTDCLMKKESTEESQINVSIKDMFKNGIGDKIKTNFLDYLKEDSIKYELKFDDQELNKVFEWCEKFQEQFNNVNEKNEEEYTDVGEMSDDKIRESDISEDFQELWLNKIKNLKENNANLFITGELYDAKDMVNHILHNVEMLYHETSSEPIKEFLNINENKTRFVISDYIRAHMISDNPVDSDKLSKEEKAENQENREKVLKFFARIAEYLYADENKNIWELIRTKYDDFDKYPDINRMKVVFCDKYIGTSMRGYDFEEELMRLEYFTIILDSLKAELDLELPGNRWNTYNAVYMLIECKEKYRFFKLFTNDDINTKKALADVVAAKEKFSFFEYAYKEAEQSDDFWDISYFLESQIYYDEKCTVKKRNNMPEKQENNKWCYINRGSQEDALNQCIKDLIHEKQGNLEKLILKEKN